MNILIVGLQNYCLNLKDTIHNLGSIYLDLLSECISTEYYELLTKSSTLTGNLYEIKKYYLKNKNLIYFIKIKGFINNSGYNLKEILNIFDFNISKVLVIHDDISIETIKISFGKGSGHHNGMKDIDLHLGRNYWRLRLGYKKPINVDSNKFVLEDIDVEYLYKLRLYSKIFLKELITSTTLTNLCEKLK